MNKFIVLLILANYPIITIAQNDTTYYNGNWQPCSKDSAKFVSTINNINNKWQEVDYYYPSMKVQMKGMLADKNLKTRDGSFVWYDEQSFVRDSTVYIKNEKQVKFVYYPNGILASKYVYKNDKAINETYYNEFGVESFDLIKYNKEKKKFNNWEDYILTSMQENLPDQFDSKNMHGTVQVEFIIGIDGNVKDITILKSSGFKELDEHAKKIILKSPRWQPATKKGIAIESKKKQSLTY